MSANKTKWVKLGDYIEEYDVRNADNKIKAVKSVSVTKQFKETGAKVNKNELKGYKLVPPFHISYVQTTKNEKCFANALNTSNETYVVTQVNKVLRSKDSSLLNIEYLHLIFRSNEFDRYVIFNSWGSARETIDWNILCDTKIPLPDIDTQQELVDTYNGLKVLAEQNEALVQPLTEACQAYIVDCIKKYNVVELRDYIEEQDEKNRSLTVKLSQGISNTKEFQEPKQVAANSTNDKIVRQGQFAYNRATTRNGEKISIAYRVGEDCTVSSAYQIFSIRNPEILNPFFLWAFFKRSEFDRYARYHSKGSAHEFFEYEDMCQVKIPLPPPEVQQAIVNLYNCAEEAKKIATEARDKMKSLCPALVQRAING